MASRCRPGLKGGRAAVLAALLAAVSAAWGQPASPPGPALAQAAPADPIKPAEKMLFLEDHLATLKPPADLVYAYEKTGQLLPASREDIHLRLKRDGKAVHAVVADANGDTPLDLETPVQGNPVILYFLQKDITEMQRLTGGQARYFQKRIRLALAAGPEIKPVKAKWAGKTVPARQVVIQPYLDDPNKDRETFQKLLGKRYTFVLSDKVPGQVVALTTEVPGQGGDFAHAAEVESLKLKAVK